MDAKKFLEEARRLSGIRWGNLSLVLCADWGEQPRADDRGGKKVEQEHPKKTRLMDFLGKYPNAPIDEDGAPALMPWSLGYCGDTPCYACEKAKGKKIKWCWEQAGSRRWKRMDNCAGCKWLDQVRTQPAGSGYCCMIERTKGYQPGDKRRYPDKERCERYKPGNWKTRWKTEVQDDETD